MLAISNALNVPGHVIDAAQRLFRVALNHNFVQGRRTEYVICACLYIACRRASTAHMLIDFSDLLQANVYRLGQVFLKLLRLLKLSIPLVDPLLYIDRFAAKLEFHERTQKIVTTATRLVARMKRDWIQVGRRPSGLCGAALLISARLHGFRRTQKEIIRVVKICDVTLRKRLNEFAATPSGQLSPHDFETVDLEKESDPPAFLIARKRRDKARGDLENQEESWKEKLGRRRRPPFNLQTKITIEGGESTDGLIERSIETVLSTEMMTATAMRGRSMIGQEESVEEEMARTLASEDFRVLERQAMDGMLVPIVMTTTFVEDKEEEEGEEGREKKKKKENVMSKMVFFEKSPSQEKELLEEFLEGKTQWSELDDDEVQAVLLTEEEIQLKTRVWVESNRDYLDKQEGKKKID